MCIVLAVIGQGHFYPLYFGGFPIYIDTICMGLPIVYFKGPQVKILNYDVFLSLKVLLIINLSKHWRPR